jgi:hypothetical protein
LISLPKTNNFITFDPLDPRGHTSVGRFLIEKKGKIKNSLYMKNNYEKREKCVWRTMKHIGTQSMQKMYKREKLNKERVFLFELNSVNGKHNKTEKGTRNQRKIFQTIVFF